MYLNTCELGILYSTTMRDENYAYKSEYFRLKQSTATYLET